MSQRHRTRPAPQPSTAGQDGRDAQGRAPGHELYGEPAGPSRKLYRLPPAGRTPELPLLEAAREAVMAGRNPGQETVRRFTPSVDARPGDVPQEGTPDRTGEERTTGSTLPVVSASRSIPDTGDQWASLLEAGRILEPPYDPWLLVCAVDESDTLPQCVDVMARNIGGHGIQIDPLFPTRDPTTGAELEPPPEAKAEREALELWLAALNVPHGLQGLLDLADRDTESVGWGCLEVLRDQVGAVADLGHIPAYTIRMGPEHVPTLVDRTIRHPATGKLVTVRRWARFRLYCQLKEGRTVWFKGYGDPRHVNWQTGQIRAVEAGPWGLDEAGNSLDATELIVVKLYHPATSYGVPRWLGGIPHVRASRSAAELLVDWFDNAPIGVKLAWISGGRWKDGGLEALQDALNHAGRGRVNAWNVVGLEGDSGAKAERDPLDTTTDAPARAGLEDLATDLPEGLYRGRESLIDRSSVRVRAMFRLGAIYFGDSEAASNRAESDTARAIGEEQVFRPIRLGRWENLINLQILPELGINFWKITLKGATTADDTEGLGKALPSMVQGGGATPNGLARLYSEMTGQAVELIAEPWGDRPLALTLAILQAGGDPNKPLAELAEDLAAKAEEAAKAKADAAASPQAGRPPGGAQAPPRPAPARKGADELGATAAQHVQDILVVREAVLDLLHQEAAAQAHDLAELPAKWGADG